MNTTKSWSTRSSSPSRPMPARAPAPRRTARRSSTRPRSRSSQKGTGRARAGMTSSPLWRGGGRIFPNSPDENFTQKINKKMYRAGMASIFSQLARDGRLAVVESLKVDTPKTKQLAAKFKAMNLESVLVIADEVDENLYLASRNLANVLDRRAALRRSAVPGALQEGAGHQGRHGQAQGDVRMSRVNPTPVAHQVRRRPPDAGAGRPDRLREGDARGRQDQRRHLQGAAGRHQARDQGRRRTDVQGQVKGVSVLNTKGKHQALRPLHGPPRQRSQGLRDAASRARS